MPVPVAAVVGDSSAAKDTEGNQNRSRRVATGINGNAMEFDVTADLPSGTVVWGRVRGYPWWPGLAVR